MVGGMDNGKTRLPTPRRLAGQNAREKKTPQKTPKKKKIRKIMKPENKTMLPNTEAYQFARGRLQGLLRTPRTDGTTGKTFRDGHGCWNRQTSSLTHPHADQCAGKPLRFKGAGFSYAHRGRTGQGRPLAEGHIDRIHFSTEVAYLLKMETFVHKGLQRAIVELGDTLKEEEKNRVRARPLHCCGGKQTTPRHPENTPFR
jgi:hypothetical protein